MANVGWLKFIMVLRAMPPSDGRCGLAQTWLLAIMALRAMPPSDGRCELAQT